MSPYEPYVVLCEKLNEIALIRYAKSVLFLTGAEAVENAVKIALIYTGRQGVIAFRCANVFHAPFPIAYHGITVDAALAGLETIFKNRN